VQAEAPRSQVPSLQVRLAEIDRASAYVARRHHLSPEEAEDFASHVRLKMMEDGYAVFDKFQGRSSLRTYLAVVVGRLFLDYRISAWGKWRPSAEARRAGRPAILLEQLITRDGWSLDEAFHILTLNHGVAMTRSAFDALAARLPARSQRRFESELVLAEVPAADAAADRAVLDHERDLEATRVIATLRRVMNTLPAQDRLILSMRFEDGRKVSDIAASLHLDAKPLYRRVDALLRTLREALQQDGIDGTTVAELFDGAR
jgi:RNA polymerase sigma factor (sigma-70 family)